MKILLPVDNSEPALEAVRHALNLLRAGLHTSFVLATVQEPVYLYEMILPPDAEVLERVSGAVGAQALEGAEALFKSAGVSYEREIASGDPAQSIIDIASRAGWDAIIMGARGLGALRSALLGSVTQRVVQDAPMPVTIVKHSQSNPPRESACG